MAVREPSIEVQRCRCVTILCILMTCCLGTAQDVGARGPAGIPGPHLPSASARGLDVVKSGDPEADVSP